MPAGEALIIKKAIIADAAILAKIGADTFYHTFRPFNTEEDMQAYLAKSYDTALIINNLNNPAIHYFLCEHNGNCVGYIKLIEGTQYEGVGDRAIELEKIYVLHTYFGTAAGKLLMEKAVSYARELGFKKLFLGVWQENKRAVSFYTKTGFNTVTTRQFKLGETICDDFIMVKEL
jgi:diamine N-acetyltransferase